MKRIMAIAATEKYILQKNYCYNAYENDVDNVSLFPLSSLTHRSTDITINIGQP